MAIGDIELLSMPGGECQHDVDYAECDGRLLNIADYPDLYAVIGTKHGGDGVITFALPNIPRSETLFYHHIQVL